MYNYFINRIVKQLIIGFSKRAGRNFFGRKTIFTQGGGLKLKLRLVDFKRNFVGNALLLTIEKDISRTGFIGLICYDNGLFNYILLSSYDKFIGKTLIRGFSNVNKINSSSFLFNIATGSLIYHIELYPGSNGMLSRAAGTSSFIVSKDNNYTFLKMNSRWLLKLSNFCIGIYGNVSNENHAFSKIKKAGKLRQLGFKPTVRGIAKNPCDHPHGGGEGRGSPKKAQRTPWGKLTKVSTKQTKLFKIKKKLFKIFKKK